MNLIGLFKAIFSKRAIAVNTGGERRIGNIRLWFLLKKKFPKANIYLEGKDHVLVNLNKVREFLARNETDKAKYDKDYMCGDFSFRLQGQFSTPEWAKYAIGLCWTESHAFNCLIDEDRQIWLVEPQNDELTTELKPYMGKRIQFVAM